MLFVVVTIAISAVLAGCAVLGARAHATTGRLGWALLALGVAPATALYLYSPDLRVVSSHGFLHASIVYRILDVGLPPDCPVLAHEPLLYPWAHHALVAALVAATGLSPAWSFALLNLAALAGTLALAYRLGAFISGDRVAGALAAAVSVYGTTFLSPLFRPLYDWTGLPAFSLRNPVVVKKFTNLQSNSLGYLFFAMALYAATRIFTERDPRRSRGAYGLLAIAVVGAAFLYPISWLGVGASLVAMAAVALWRDGTRALPTVVRAGAVSLGASLLAAPYLYEIAAGKTEQMYTFLPYAWVLLNRLLSAVVTLGPAAALCVWQRRAVRDALRRGDGLLHPVAAAAAMTLAYVLVTSDWNSNEYKFLGMACFATGIATSVALAALQRRSALACFALLTAFFFSAGADIQWKGLRRTMTLSDRYVESGRTMHHADPNEDALYGWLLANTEPDAVIVDDRMTVPFFARRALYVGLDGRGVAASREIEDGWHLAPQAILLRYFAYPRETVARRSRVAHELLRNDAVDVPADALDALREDAGESEVFLIARDVHAAERFSAEPRLEQVATTPRALVFRLRQR